MTDFKGAGIPLTQSGMETAANRVSLGMAELWSVVSVETSGFGFLPDRRPKILFERHIFRRITGGKFDADDPNVSQPSQGGYGPGGAHQYDRLAAAILLDRTAALQSASWGMGQIMGENFQDAGFAQVEDMVTAMAGSEDNQLQAMVAFISTNGLDKVLHNRDWAGFARRYNGPNYAANNYDGLLQHFYERYSSGPTPDLRVRTVQAYLTYKGFAPGGVDGILGKNTQTAVKAFQTANRLEATGIIDDDLLLKLSGS